MTTRIITVIPINFRNDTTQPETPEQIRASLAPNEDPHSGTYGNLLRESTNGQVVLDVRVLPYVTLSFDKACGNWTSAARSAAQAAGHNIVGTAWAYSPLTFGQCSEQDRVGNCVHGGFTHLNFPFIYQSSMGLSSVMPAWSWLCKDPAGRWASVSASCEGVGVRHFRTAGGQAWGPMVAHERKLLGTLAADRIVTVPANAALPQTFTLFSLDWPTMPPDGAVQVVQLPGWAIGDTVTGVGSGISLEYHAPSRWRDVLEHGKLTATVLGTTRLLDFTPVPDGEVRPGPGRTHALAPGESVTHPTNGQRITVVSADAATLTFRVEAASAEEPIPPPPPPPPPPPAGTDVVDVASVTDAGGHVFTLKGRVILRDGVDTGGAGDALAYVGGVVYTKAGTDYYKWYDPGWGYFGPTLPGATTTPPPPLPEWSVVAGTIEQHRDRTEWRLTLTSGVVVVIPKP